jgi:hypothetical protein
LPYLVLACFSRSAHCSSTHNSSHALESHCTNANLPDTAV